MEVIAVGDYINENGQIIGEYKKGGKGMKAEDWIKVEDRLPECIFGDTQTMHYSRNVLVAMRWINGCSSYWVIRIACYDKILDKWLDHNDVPYEGVEYWMPIVLPKEERK